MSDTKSIPSDERKPNIVFAFADDWGRYANIYSKYENQAPITSSVNKFIHTPNFDRVAEEGVLFLNALVPAPSCTPCRSSVLSGRYFWQTGLGAILSGAVWDNDIQTFPMELEKNGGYFIGYTYKVWAPGLSLNAPMGGTRTQYQRAGGNFAHFSHWVTCNAEKFGSIEAAKNALFEETRSNFKQFIDAWKESKEECPSKPFMYWWGPTNTHRTWEQGSGKQLWNIDPDKLEGHLPAFLSDVHEIREDVADYLGECQAVDGGIGVLLEELEKIGELENTLFVVSGDHGIPGVPRAKCNLYDIGCEVALAARWPKHIKPGRVINDFVNLMDLAPTFCEVGEVAIPDCMVGKSLLPLLTSEVMNGQTDATRNFVVMGRERHVHVAREKYLPYPQRCVRTGNYIFIINFEPDRWPMGDPKGLDDLKKPCNFEKLRDDTFEAYPDLDASPTKAWMIQHREDLDVEPLFELSFGKRPREELYDLKKDPYYMHNVAYEEGYQNIKKELETLLMNVLRENQDPRVVGEDGNERKCRFEYEPYAGPIQLFQVGPTMFGPPGNFTNSEIANLQLRLGGPPEALDIINKIVPPFKD